MIPYFLLYYRLNTGAKDTSDGSYWSNSYSDPNSKIRAVREHNMDASSFYQSSSEAILKTITSPKQAFSGSSSYVYRNKKAGCKVSTGYQSVLK